jgi:hypothetical protein
MKHNKVTKAASSSVQPVLQQPHCWLSGRLTANKLVQWCNEQFKKFEIKNYEVTEISRTHFNQDAYENGACRLLVRFRDKTMPEGSHFSTGYFMCFYRLSEYQEYLNMGYSLYLKDTSHFGLLKDMEIEVRKP